MKSILRFMLILRCWLLAAIERDPEQLHPQDLLDRLRRQRKEHQGKRRALEAATCPATPRRRLRMGLELTCVHPGDGPAPEDTPPVILNDH